MFLLVLLGLFQLPSNILWAQNPELSNHTWYFNHGEVNGESFAAPNTSFAMQFYIYNTGLHYTYITCNTGYGFDISYDNENLNFELLNGPVYISEGDTCLEIEQQQFVNLHNLVYFLDNETIKNSFTYLLTSVDDYFQLKIENGEGDWAVYNSVALSEPSFETKKFNLYPNPVTNILNIQGSNDVLQNARLELYDVTGKSLAFETIATDANFVSINVSHLNSGIYFLKINHKDTYQETLRFVKP